MKAPSQARAVTLFEAVVVLGFAAGPWLMAWAGVSPGLIFLSMVLYGPFMRRALRRHFPPAPDQAATR